MLICLDNLEKALFLMYIRRVKYLVILRNGVWDIEKVNSIGVKSFILTVF